MKSNSDNTDGLSNINSCSNCLNNVNEPYEGPCAGCYRSIGIDDMHEPSEPVVALGLDFIIEAEEEDNESGC